MYLTLDVLGSFKDNNIASGSQGFSALCKITTSVHIYNGPCHKEAIAGGGGYYPATCSYASCLCNSFEDWAPIDFVYGCPIFKWVAAMWPKT